MAFPAWGGSFLFGPNPIQGNWQGAFDVMIGSFHNHAKFQHVRGSGMKNLLLLCLILIGGEMTFAQQKDAAAPAQGLEALHAPFGKRPAPRAR